MFKKILLFSVGLFVIGESVGIYKNSTCPSIKLKYGRTRYRQKGRFAKFVCNTGYLIAGEKYSTCVNGAWDGAIPKCVRASCKKVNPPTNLSIYPSHRGAVLNFFCKPTYDLRGPSTIYCDGHNWDNNLPTCIATNTTPSFTCNFESADLCGWNHDLRHEFDWTRMNFKTPSGHLGTGPSFDHTLGEGRDGYYMYIESSSRKINDTARLISPIYDKINDNVCLEFYYHMHGASTGQLRVYLKRLSDPWLLYPENAIFWKMGNHGNRWLQGFIQLGAIPEDFQIIIEGVRGASFYSDIAIDDITIIPNCSASDITTERDIMENTDYLPTQSCFNRCDNDTTITNTNLVSCGCDDSCTENNTCCPDYVALCVIGVTDDGNMTTETTSVYVEISASTSTKLNKTTTSSTTTQVRSSTSASTTTLSTAGPTSSQISTTKNATAKPVLSTTNTTKLQSAPPTKTSTTPLQKIPSPTIKPFSPIFSSSKAPLSSPARPPAELPKMLTNPPKPPVFPKYIAKQISITKQTNIPKTTPTYNDDAKVPVHLDYNDDEEELDIYKERIVTASAVLNEKIVKEAQSSSMTIVIAVVAVTVFVSIILGAVLVKRYRNTFNRSRIRNSGSASQSDVRFLTSDEILDFSMAYTDE